MARKRQRKIPDVSNWKPKKGKSNLESAFLAQCKSTEQIINAYVNSELQLSQDNFASGLGVESVVREHISKLFPERYKVTSGMVDDRDGFTAGDFDIVVYNSIWFPSIKLPATTDSRNRHFAIEGVYSVGEVKQTLSAKTLDEAMEKLTTCHRLRRPQANAFRLVENDDSGTCRHGLSNPLYSFIIATRIAKSTSFDELILRFHAINSQLPRLEMVRALCVLGEGVVLWGYRDKEGEIRPASFMLSDLYEEVFLALSSAKQYECALYPFLVDLLSHVFASVLAPEDIAALYGPSNFPISIPKDPNLLSIAPDREWLERLDYTCNKNHEFPENSE